MPGCMTMLKLHVARFEWVKITVIALAATDHKVNVLACSGGHAVFTSPPPQRDILDKKLSSFTLLLADKERVARLSFHRAIYAVFFFFKWTNVKRRKWWELTGRCQEHIYETFQRVGTWFNQSVWRTDSRWTDSTTKWFQPLNAGTEMLSDEMPVLPVACYSVPEWT